MSRGVSANSIGTGIGAASVCALLSLFVTFQFATPAHAAGECAETTSAALQQALVALDANDPARDREALVCMIAAVATLDAKLQGLSDGSIPFDGRIYIPHGYVISKPPAEEAD